MTKPVLWLFVCRLDRPDAALALASASWIAEQAGAILECYLEARRNGQLFAQTGSTVIGGHHHQQFNYLCSAFDVRAILLGEPTVFASSLAAFGIPILARAENLTDLYEKLLAAAKTSASSAVVAPCSPVSAGEKSMNLAPYLFPETHGTRSLAFPPAEAAKSKSFLTDKGIRSIRALYLSKDEEASLRAAGLEVETIDSLQPDDSYGSITMRIAERWKSQAGGVAFGDPDAILPQIPAHCRDRRVAVYAPTCHRPRAEIRVSAYMEQKSTIADRTAALAEQIGNRVLVGRQTCDGDILTWSKKGVCIQITDPNRPAFPAVALASHPWTCRQDDIFADEPDDAALARFADEGKTLATLIWHSGEMAHNEAMIELFDLACFSDLKMGIGTHAARYETCPQLWELLSVPRDRGGVRGLIEPVLHSGGMGVMAEHQCPPERLAAHCRAALERIGRLAGPAGTPRGYYAFLDADPETLAPARPAVYDAVAGAGLEYFVSSAHPGRNRIIRDDGKCIIINHSCRSIYSASPFMRITTVEELDETSVRMGAGWLIATLDSPVIAFKPYIWRHGSRFMQIVDRLRGGGSIVNVLPRTVARYARLLAARGELPPPAKIE